MVEIHAGSVASVDFGRELAYDRGLRVLDARHRRRRVRLP